jgi:hypothetical protein
MRADMPYDALAMMHAVSTAIEPEADHTSWSDKTTYSMSMSSLQMLSVSVQFLAGR